MPSLRVQDRALLTATELALMESSQPSRIRAYTSAQLNDRIARARRFWDKYRELARRQQRTTKTSRQRGHLQPSRRCEPSARPRSLPTVAKGYGVDRVAELLTAHGSEHYMVEIGGEIRVRGLKEHDRPWRIAIEKP